MNAVEAICDLLSFVALLTFMYFVYVRANE